MSENLHAMMSERLLWKALESGEISFNGVLTTFKVAGKMLNLHQADKQTQMVEIL